MKLKMSPWIAVICCVAMSSQAARGQNTPPFFGGGVVAFDPEISVIRSGALLGVRATASADLKYVTIGGQATNTGLQSLQTFPVNVPNPQGFVGGVNLPDGTAVATADSNVSVTALSAAYSPELIERAAKSWVFTRSGMYLIAPLK